MLQCRYCKETLATGARYCKECNHWQGWYGAVLGHLSLGDITVAITLVTLVVATFRSTFFGDHADPVYTRLSCADFEMTILASNEGRRDGALANPEFTVGGGGTVVPSVTVDDEAADVVRLPRSGAAALVTARMNSGAKPNLLRSVDAADPACSVSLVAQGFGVRGSPRPQTLGQCPCKEFIG